MTLFVASEIARVYQQDNRNEVALRFYERIAKTYRKDGWNDLLTCICSRMVQCATQLDQPQVIFESLIEQLATCPASKVGPVHEQLITSAADFNGKIEINMDQIASFLTCDTAFKVSDVHVQGSPQWQMCLSNQSFSSLPSSFCISSVLVSFSNPVYDYSILPSFVKSSQPVILVLSTEKENHAVDLSLDAGRMVAYQKIFVPIECQDLSILVVTVCVETSNAKVHLIYKINERNSLKLNRKWLNENLEWVKLPGIKDQREIR